MHHFLSCPTAFAGLAGNSLDGNFKLSALKQRCRSCQGIEKEEEVAEHTRKRMVYVCVVSVLLFPFYLQL